MTDTEWKSLGAEYVEDENMYVFRPFGQTPGNLWVAMEPRTPMVLAIKKLTAEAIQFDKQQRSREIKALLE